MSEIWGFIGGGNMGGALMRAAVKTLPAQAIRLADPAPAAQEMAKTLGTSVTDNTAIAQTADYIFLGVKPQMMGDMLAGIREELARRQNTFTLVSMAAGLSIADIRRMAGGDYPVIRIMPNLPVGAGEGMILYTRSSNVSGDRVIRLKEGLKAAGCWDELPENLIDAGSAVSGCGPAFVSLMIEALADGGVACGLPRQKALLYAEQTVKGTAAQLMATESHPAALKDAVCSPGGSTIAGVCALEQGGFRAAAVEAVIAAYARTKELGK